MQHGTKLGKAPQVQRERNSKSAGYRRADRNKFSDLYERRRQRRTARQVIEQELDS